MARVNGTPASQSKVVLSTTSVYPDGVEAGFEVAAALGFDGIELMVGIDPLAADVDAVERLRDTHQVPVTSVHAPCLLVTQKTWGRDPWTKLQRSGKAAERLGATTVVVHPPFRWQKTYATGFVKGIARLNHEFPGVTFAVENMYPWRSFARPFQAYLPAYDPSELPYNHLVLDCSHASTAQMRSRDLAAQWGDRLHHVHLTDGVGSIKDDHLFPGEGTQESLELLDDLRLAGFTGDIVLEVNSRRSGGRAGREARLGDSLIAMRERLGEPVSETTETETRHAHEEEQTAPHDLVAGDLPFTDGPHFDLSRSGGVKH